ncbi:MAG: hypothetical protein E7446_04660 [Ruminococcaceae bacterium]|nr:hypothetical protein [Oscillospiraceae bacterium]
MRKQVKRTLALLLVLGTLLPMLLVSAHAVQPRYIGTSMITTNLNIQTVGGTIGYAECVGYVELYMGYHATMVMELQQAGTTIKSWSCETDTETELCKYWNVPGGYVYCVKVTVYTYNSNNVLVETNTIYSPEQYYIK